MLRQRGIVLILESVFHLSYFCVRNLAKNRVDTAEAFVAFHLPLRFSDTVPDQEEIAIW